MFHTYEFTFPRTLIESGLMAADTEYEMRATYSIIPGYRGGKAHPFDRFGLPDEDPEIEIKELEVYGHPVEGGKPRYGAISGSNPLWDLASDWVLEHRRNDLLHPELDAA